MIVRFGYVAMSTVVKNASPSKTMTATNFAKLVDREAAVRKLERIASENLHNTLRLLRHNRAHDIMVYRFSSKLIPLWGHEMLGEWNPIPALKDDFAAIGDYVKQHNMRVSFHPDHFTVFSTPKTDVLRKSVLDLERHMRMLEAMGLDESVKNNIHIGGTYGNKEKAFARFIKQFGELRPEIRRRMTLENDDKTFTALETLEASEQVRVPMVLDVHHHMLNHAGEDAVELWPRIAATWERFAPGLPPKIHVSSPKNEKDPRSHADYVAVADIWPFLKGVADKTPRLDVMIEAKMKDDSLIKLMKDLEGQEEVRVIDQASVEISS